MSTGVSSGTVDIGEVVRRSGVAPSTLHLWERHGLLEPIGRRGLRRQYPADILETIAVIVVCQRSGFTLAAIEKLLASDGADDRQRMLEEQLVELRERRRQLTAAIDGLEHAIACPNPSPRECPDFRAMLAAALPVERGA